MLQPPSAFSVVSGCLRASGVKGSGALNLKGLVPNLADVELAIADDAADAAAAAAAAAAAGAAWWGFHREALDSLPLWHLPGGGVLVF